MFEYMKWQRDFITNFMSRALVYDIHSIYLSAPPGTGKTITVLGSLYEYHIHPKLEDLDMILVLAPKSAHDAWKKDSKLFPPIAKKLEVMTYESFTSKAALPDELPAKYDNIQDWIGSVDDPWGRKHKITYLVCDEAHRVNYKNTKRTKLGIIMEARFLGRKQSRGQEVLTKMTKCIMMSGTPADKLDRLYLPYMLIDPATWDYSTYFKFEENFFYKDRFNRIYPSTMGEAEIHRRISQRQWVLPDDLLPKLPPVHTEFIQLENSLSKINKTISEYKSLIEYPILIALQSYLLGQGVRPALNSIDDILLKDMVLGDMAGGEVFDTAKIDWVLDYLKDNPKCIIFTMFKSVLFYLKDKLKDKAYFVHGGDKSQLQDAIDKADKPLIATFSVKEGANLQKYNTCIFMSLPYSYKDYDQAQARINRKGQKLPTTIKILQHSRADKWVWDLLQSKGSVQHELRKHSLPYKIYEAEELEEIIND